MSRESRNREGTVQKARGAVGGTTAAATGARGAFAAAGTLGHTRNAAVISSAASVAYTEKGAPRVGPKQRRWERRGLMTQSVYNPNNDM